MRRQAPPAWSPFHITHPRPSGFPGSSGRGHALAWPDGSALPASEGPASRTHFCIFRGDMCPLQACGAPVAAGGGAQGAQDSPGPWAQSGAQPGEDEGLEATLRKESQEIGCLCSPVLVDLKYWTGWGDPFEIWQQNDPRPSNSPGTKKDFFSEQRARSTSAHCHLVQNSRPSISQLSVGQARVLPLPREIWLRGPTAPQKSRSCLPGPPASSGGRPWIRVTRARAGRGRGEARVRDGRGKNEHGPVLIQLPPLPRRHRTSQEPFLVCQQFLLHTGFLHDSQSLGGGQEAVRIPGGDFLGHRQCPWGGGRQPEPAPEASEALWLNRGFRVFTPVCGCQLPKLLTVEKVITWLRLRSLLRTFTQRKQEDRHLAGECAPNGRRPKSMPSRSRARGESGLPRAAAQQGGWDICQRADFPKSVL